MLGQGKMRQGKMRMWGQFMSRSAGLALLVVLLTGINAAPALAELKIDITRGNVEPMPIAISQFVGSIGDNQLGVDIAAVVSADLERSGLFRPINPKAFIQKPEAMQHQPRVAAE